MSRVMYFVLGYHTIVTPDTAITLNIGTPKHLTGHTLLYISSISD